MLAQVSNDIDESKLQHIEKNRKERLDAGLPMTKQMNTRGTMLLYFCIMTVLTCCCLGRCLIVPITQESHYEINSRKHMTKFDKNGFIQQEVIH